MSRTIRCAVLVLAVTATACSSSVTEPTAARTCTAKSQNNSQSCLSQDYINPKV